MKIYLSQEVEFFKVTRTPTLFKGHVVHLRVPKFVVLICRPSNAGSQKWNLGPVFRAVFVVHLDLV